MPLNEVLFHCCIDMQHQYQDLNQAAALHLLSPNETVMRRLIVKGLQSCVSSSSKYPQSNIYLLVNMQQVYLFMPKPSEKSGLSVLLA